ncbi:MAG: DUF2520 domain-containing protein [Proteobacteria bacterium]|nr:DUF2520 domain-containing protein [Pseudomonadota bacterium]
MGQVPHYMIIGNGRVARHFCHYLSLLKIPFSHWHRPDPPARLKPLLRDATHVLALINDQAIDPFITEHLQASPAIKVHFSGALVSQMAYGAHPLMTFNTGFYTLDKYQSIPFVVDTTAPDFTTLLPGLPNHHVKLAPELKAKYHAMCVLSGNFSCLLWQKFFSALESEFHLPAKTGYTYLRQQTENLLTDYVSAFTGPLARGDVATIQKNLAALKCYPFQQIYQSFVNLKEKIS